MDSARNFIQIAATNASRALTAVQFRLATVSLLVLGTWYQVLGTWYQVLSTWYLVPSTKYLVLGSKYLVLGNKYLIWTNCKDTVASLNWTAVRALEAFVAPKRVEFRGASNGNTPRTPKFTKQKSKMAAKARKSKNAVFYRIF